MERRIKVVKRMCDVGWLSSNLQEDALATEIQEQEDHGWQLVTSFGMASALLGEGITDTIVFIYRKK